MSAAATISALEARTEWSDIPLYRTLQEARISRIEDYLLINGDHLSARQAAARLGVSSRTVVRYRTALRALREASCPA